MADDSFETEVFIDAPPERVFDHFCQPELLVRWMGDFARLEANAGGAFSVDINGVLIRGQYIRLDRPTAIEIAWGELGNDAMPPGSTRLQIALQASDRGTLLRLRHDGLVPAEAAKHAVGWLHFLARLVIASAGGDPGPDPFATTPAK